ncbi:histamine N-methyltransferase A-like [Glandiceps talaboti]
MSSALKMREEFPDSFTINHNEYHDRYKICVKNGLAERIAHSVADMEEVFGKLCLDTKGELQVLSIGTGNGKNEVPIINALHRQYPNMVYDFIEPAQGQVDEFHSLIQSHIDEWKGISFKEHVQTIDEFIEESKGQDVQYDVIIAIHSAYHFKGGATTICKLYDWLIKGGILLFRMGSGGWPKCSAKISDYYKNPMITFFGSEDLQEILKGNISEAEREEKHRKGKFKVTECFLEPSEDGNKMLDIIFGVINFRQNVPRATADNLLAYMRECCTEEEDDLFLSDNDDDLIFRK